MKKVIAVTGPTASGKTKLAIKIANYFKTPIISCDSVAVYRGLDIGSAKPTKEELKQAKHYLIDILDPKDSFDVATCQKMARAIIDKEKLSILCGGTGLYISAILNDYEFKAPKRDESFAKTYSNYSNDELYNLLKIHDEKKALELHPNNRKRVLRALEASLSGNNLSEATNKKEALYDSYIIYLDMDRNVLYQRIDQRVEEMFKLGLEKEAYKLYQEGSLVNAIGYKEFLPYFNHLISLEEVKEAIKTNTRHLAKRQRTWFKNQMKAHFFDALSPTLVSDVLTELKKFEEEQ